MTSALLPPLVVLPLEVGDIGPGHGLWELVIGLGCALLVSALIVLAVVTLRRSGVIPDLFSAIRPVSPEAHARRLLAERFAKGEVSSEDFMERASILNWTPGSDLVRPVRRAGR